MSGKYPVIAALLLLGLALPVRADAPASGEDIKNAVNRSIALLQKSGVEYPKHRDCFSCHNQGVPILALTTARSRGFPIDEEGLQKQLRFTAAFLTKNRDNYQKGRGQGGQVDTAGYALWALAAGGWKSDATTAAVAEYLTQRDKEHGHWRAVSKRPPSENSPFTATYLAVRGLQVYGVDEHKERSTARIEAARRWLLQNPAKDTEDRVFRLRALHRVQADDKEIQAAAKELLQTQRKDGGWAQLDEMESDTYATGTVLAALHEAGGLAASAPAYQQGVKFLLASQGADGSWLVRSRSRPFQLYFESGFPHGKDQFISMAASSWATVALALACPVPATGAN